MTSTVNLDSEYSREVSEVGEYEAPEAGNTTILVVGGTGRQAATNEHAWLSWQAHDVPHVLPNLVGDPGTSTVDIEVLVSSLCELSEKSCALLQKSLLAWRTG